MSGARCPLCGAVAVDLFAVPDWLEGRRLFDLKRCAACTLAFLHPVPDEAERAALRGTEERYYELVDSHREEFEGVARRLLDAIGAHRSPPGRLLDVGCGRGIALAEAARRGWTAVGVDTSPDACAAVRALGLEAVEGDFRDVALEPASFDVVLLEQVLEHTSDPAGLLGRARELLRPDGLLYVATPNAAGLLARARGPAFNYWIPPEHVFHYSPRALRRVLEANGFAVASLTTVFCDSPLANDLRDVRRHHRLWSRLPPRLAGFLLRRLRGIFEARGDGTMLEALARPGPGRT